MMMEYRKERVEVLLKGESISQILKDGESCWVPTSKLSEIKPTKKERYIAQVEVIRSKIVSYKIAGWIAVHDSIIHVSTPPNQLDDTCNELDSHGVEYEIGKTLSISTDATQGRSYSVVTEDHEAADILEKETGVVSTVYHSGSTHKVSMQAKQFILDFLLDDLKFRLGKVQDLKDIRSRIPEQFVRDFDFGAKKVAEVV